MITREQIVTEARTWKATRWQHQASLKGVACDCVGLVRGVARALGHPDADRFDADNTFKGYGRIPNPSMLLAACREFLDPVPKHDVLPGDILVMRFAKEPQHFAIVSDAAPLSIVHAYAQARGVVEHGVDALWRSRILCAFSFRGVA